MMKKLLSVTALLFILPLAWVGEVSAEGRVLDTLEQVSVQGHQALRIQFARQMQYMNHSPRKSGKQLRIELRPVGAADDNLTVVAEPPERESLPWKASPGVPVSRVLYEEIRNEHSLIIHFERDVEFDVRESSDFTSLDIIITSGAPAAALPQLAPAPVATFWAINLQDAAGPIDTASLPKIALLSDKQIYVARFTSAGKPLYRLRAGFYASEQEAKRAAAGLIRSFTKAQVVRVSAGEYDQINKRGKSELDPKEQARVDRLMNDAHKALLGNDAKTAIRLYTQIIQMPENGATPAAIEMLGVARERNGQVAHAKAEYERYLQRYPKGENAVRVRQRLNTLVTASLAPREELRKVGQKERKEGWELFGSLSQYYRRDASKFDGQIATTDRTDLSSDVSVIARKRTETQLHEVRFTGGYRHDLLTDGSGSQGNVSSMYYDIRALNRDYQVRIGRQSNTHGGVLGRFDGIFADHRLGKLGKITMVLGAPVDRSTQNPSGDRMFYGVGYDMERLAKVWDVGLYAITQTNLGIADRQAVGAEVRYLNKNTTVFGLFDYDTLFKQINTVMLLGNWRAGDNAFNATIDKRRSPTLSTTNALIGQIGVDRLDRLADLYTEEAMRQLALDRSAESSSFTFGYSRVLNEVWQLNFDLGQSSMSEMPASGGVAAVPASGSQSDFQLQAVGSSLLMDGDIGIISLRHSSSSNSSTNALNLQGRYPYEQWRFTPRLRYSMRNYTGGALTDSQRTLSPSGAVEYRYGKNIYLDGEIGYNDTQRSLTDGTSQHDTSNYMTLGYRWEF